jgi:hypothetical protein
MVSGKMKENYSIRALKEMSSDFQNKKSVGDPAASPQNLHREYSNWGDRFLRLVEEIEKRLKNDPQKSLKN